MVQDGAQLFVEIGPGQVLTGLLKRIDRTVQGTATGTVESLEKAIGSLK
jgi:[acyl-carrier-protein] S-malonyltransferase